MSILDVLGELVTKPESVLENDLLLDADGCTPPGDFVVPKLRIPAGLRPADAVARALSFYRECDRSYPKTAQRRAETERALEQLLDSVADAPRGSALPRSAPPFARAIDDALCRLARGVGADEAALRQVADGVPNARGPFDYLTETLSRGGRRLLEPLVERSPATWLARWIATPKPTRRPKPALYPRDSRPLLKDGVVPVADGERLLVVHPGAAGIAEVHEVLPDEPARLVGADVVNFLRREVALALGEEPEPLELSGTVTAPPPDGRSPVGLLRAEEAPSGVTRIGGRPVGIDADRWPRYEGRPMQHVLTLEVSALGWKAGAVSLFLSSLDRHEAYAPGNTHAAVIQLSRAEVARGEQPLPPDLAESELLPVCRLDIDAQAMLKTRKQRLGASFAVGLSPEWLQDPVNYPGHFVMQFGRELVPGLNLGDKGILYVTTETAFFQCL